MTACSSSHLITNRPISAATNINIVIDTDGDHLPDTPSHLAEKVKFAGGIYHGVVLHNADDDDGDKALDDLDDIINGSEDLKDLYPIRLDILEQVNNGVIQIQLLNAPKGTLGLFHQQSNGDFVELNTNEPLFILTETIQQAPMFFVEGRAFSDENWDGQFSLSFSTFDTRSASQKSSSTLMLRVAPWLMLSNASEAEVLYIREHIGYNDNMIKQLTMFLPEANTKLQIVPADVEYPPSEIWMQDTLEIGRQYTPFRSMPVVLQANRGRALDHFSKDQLLGPDFGWMQIGDYREKYARGYVEGQPNVGWMDWFGNLEVSPPLPQHPHGRMYFGEAGKDIQLDQRIVSKIAAQGLQQPFKIDVSFLMIKHADEAVSWAPGKDGRWYMLVPSPKEMLLLAEKLSDQGFGQLPMLRSFEDNYTIEILLADAQGIAHNMQIEEGALAKNIHTLKQALGIQDDQIIKVPAWINTDGTSLIPNMVNSVVANGLFLAPNPQGPTVEGLDLIAQDFVERMSPIDLKVIFIDDQQYHRWWGNVHCATNVKRTGTEHIQALMK